MTDFDALIDKVVESAQELEYEHEHRGFYMDSIKKNHDSARSALREAISEVVKENDDFRKMMKNIFEDLPKEQLIGIIHSMQDNRATMFVKHEARVAALEAEYEEAMQFILAVNQPHDYDCANYRDETKPCDCGYEELTKRFNEHRARVEREGE